MFPNFRFGDVPLGIVRLSILQHVVRRTFKVSNIASVEFIGCFLYPFDARSTQNSYTEKFQLTPDCMFSRFKHLKTCGLTSIIFDATHKIDTFCT